MACVDSGTQVNHPDLANRMLPCTGPSCGLGTQNGAHGTHVAGIMVADGSSGVIMLAASCAGWHGTGSEPDRTALQPPGRPAGLPEPDARLGAQWRRARTTAGAPPAPGAMRPPRGRLTRAPAMPISTPRATSPGCTCWRSTTAGAAPARRARPTRPRTSSPSVRPGRSSTPIRRICATATLPKPVATARHVTGASSRT